MACKMSPVQVRYPPQIFGERNGLSAVQPKYFTTKGIILVIILGIDGTPVRKHEALTLARHLGGLTQSGQSSCFARRQPPVRIRYPPLTSNSRSAHTTNRSSKPLVQSSAEKRTRRNFTSNKPCDYGVIGSRAGFKIRCPEGREGSTPSSRTMSERADYRYVIVPPGETRYVAVDSLLMFHLPGRTMRYAKERFGQRPPVPKDTSPIPSAWELW